MGILNGGSEWSHMRLEWGAIQGSHMGLILVPLNSSRCADHFDIWLIFSMTDSSLLNGAPVWGCERASETGL